MMTMKKKTDQDEIVLNSMTDRLSSAMLFFARLSKTPASTTKGYEHNTEPA